MMIFLPRDCNIGLVKEIKRFSDEVSFICLGHYMLAFNL